MNPRIVGKKRGVDRHYCLLDSGEFLFLFNPGAVRAHGIDLILKYLRAATQAQSTTRSSTACGIF
jgi:hypothetical protein